MSQVNFLMTANDETAFVSALFARGDTHAVIGHSLDTPHPPLATLDGVLAADRLRPIILLHFTLSVPVRCSTFQNGQYGFDSFRDATYSLSIAVPFKLTRSFPGGSTQRLAGWRVATQTRRINLGMGRWSDGSRNATKDCMPIGG